MSVYSKKGRGISTDVGMRRYKRMLSAHKPPAEPWQDVVGSGLRSKMLGVADEHISRSGFFPIVPDENTLFNGNDLEGGHIERITDLDEIQPTPTSIRRQRTKNDAARVITGSAVNIAFAA